MTYLEAVSNMIIGKHLIRPGWGGFYLALLEGQEYVWQIGIGSHTASVNASIYIPSIDDTLAKDWLIKTN